MYSQVDSNGHHTLLLREITYHRKSAMAVPIGDKFVVSKTGGNFLGILPRNGIYYVYGKMVV